MKYWAQFLNNGVELLGSEGVLILDGRLNLYNMQCAADGQVYRLRNVQKITHFQIMRGERFSRSRKIGVPVKATYTRHGR